MTEIPFGKRLNYILKYKRMTQRQFAHAVGIGEDAVSKYICTSQVPRVEKLVKIADTLGVSTDYLLGLTSPQIECAFREKT